MILETEMLVGCLARREGAEWVPCRLDLSALIPLYWRDSQEGEGIVVEFDGDHSLTLRMTISGFALAVEEQEKADKMGV